MAARPQLPISPVALVGGLVAVAVVLGLLYLKPGLELKGQILKVRIAPMDEKSAVAVVDFRFVNPSSQPFWVRSVDVYIEDRDGTVVESKTIADADAKRVFEYYPLLGQKYNDSLIIRDKIAPGASLDRMISARFEISEAELAARRKLVVRIEDVDGPVSEITEVRSTQNQD